MKTIRFFVLLAFALAPLAILLTYDGDQESASSAEADPPAEAGPDGAEPISAELEAGLKAYAQAYQEESEAYRQQVLAQWGEYKTSSPSAWISYDRSGTVRRTVDYESGGAQVEMIVDTQRSIEQVIGELDTAVDRLLSTTEREAYAADVVANRVEQRLSGFESILQKGELSDAPLFSGEDRVALDIRHSGFFKVGANTRTIATTDVRAAAKEDSYIIRASFSIPHTIHERAVKYAEAVTRAAEKERISDELIYAIIETESSFNPMAKSPIPAYGLMQIVPHTAGKDATRYLYGSPKLLAPSYLYNPDNNIRVGAAYLHLLHYKYMRRVKDKESRMYCAIAAYNTGASNVARAFIDRASFNTAVPVINRLSPQEVYDKLRNYLPQSETRNYVEKVSKRMEKYL